MDLEAKMAAAMEAVQKLLAEAGSAPSTDPRSLAVARTHFETSFLWVANAVGGEPVFHD